MLNSYYFFFKSLLGILKRNSFDTSANISFQEICVDMLALAWYPHSFFRLSFGLQDQLSCELDRLNISINKISVLNDPGKNELRNIICQADIDSLSNRLLRYVPYRFLRPFFEKETRGVVDAKVNQQIVRLSQDYFNISMPPYKIDEEGRITVHNQWAKYLKNNLVIIESWIHWEMCLYMQRNNQNTPAISSKILMPSIRTSLSKQRTIWQEVIACTKINCIYSGEILGNNFSLDHFVPWSFVVHDQLWNLVPVTPSINSSKSNSLPDIDKYLSLFVELQYSAILILNKLHPEHSWNKLVEPYISDLRVQNASDLLNENIFKASLKGVILPLIELAHFQGFSPNWQYSACLSHEIHHTI